MVLMTVDHASGQFNAGRLMTDGAAMYTAGAPLPAGQFLTRWISHLCAPTFVFLAGTALALSVEKRRARGEPAWALDRFIITRGLIIAALDPIWMSWAFVRPVVVLLQVLYAIGLSLVCMALLRRLSTRAMLGVSLGLIAGGELLAGLVQGVAGRSVPTSLLLTGGMFPPVIVAYPLVPWLAVMVLGWAFGRALAEGEVRAERWLPAAGAGALGLFAVLRWLNGYGNLGLFRADGSVMQWLHVSKYPPSFTYLALELGLMALCLAFFFWLARRGGAARFLQPLLVLGQTALFFYVLHVHVLLAASHALGIHKKAGLVETWVAAGLAVLGLYPLCVWYRRYKLAHPDGWTRYL